MQHRRLPLERLGKVVSYTKPFWGLQIRHPETEIMQEARGTSREQNAEQESSRHSLSER